MATKEIKIKNFNGGMAEKQAAAPNQMSMLENFDLGNTPEFLKPLVSLSSNTGGFSSSWGVRKLLYSNSSIYGLGNVSTSNTVPKIYRLSTLLDATNSVWTQPNNADAASGSTSFKLFKTYKNYAYFFHGTDKISRFGSLSGTPTITEGWATFSKAVTVTSNAVVHPGYDKMFFAYKYNDGSGSGIASIDSAGTFNETAKTFSYNTTVNQIVVMGQLLALVGSQIDGSNSVALLWDTTSDKFTDNIDLGAGSALAGELSDSGSLICFVYQTGIFGTASRPSFIRVVEYSGGKPREIFRIKPQSGSGGYTNITITSEAQSYRGNIYLGICYSREGQITLNNGILRVGRKDSSNPTSYSIDFNISSGDLNSLGIYDFVFYQENIVAINPLTSTTSDAYISKYQPSYTSTSVYESGVKNGDETGDDSSDLKELKAVSVSYSPLRSGQQVVVKIRHDEETDWTTIFTDTTLNSGSHTAVNIEPTDANLPQFKEIEFRVDSTGGAQITGLKAKYDQVKEVYG